MAGIAALTSGCLGFLENERLVVLPHIEQYASELPDGVYFPANYAALRNWLVNLFRSGREEGIVSLAEYAGNRDEDIRSVVGVWRTDPVGEFAVDYITTQPIGRYQWSFIIHYRRGQEEIADIVQVASTSFLEGLIRQALRRADAGLVIETQRYNERDFDIAAIIDRILFEEPELCIPPLPPAVSLFPDTGSRRVVDIRFQYGDDPHRIRQNRDSAQLAVQSILGSLDIEGREPLEQAALLAESLRAWAALPTANQSALPSGEEAFLNTAYGALVLRRPTALGLALAYKQLCATAGLDCRIVAGQLERRSHVWNLLSGEDYGAHVDLFLADPIGEEPLVFRLDSEMDAAGYSWDALRYPPTPDEWPAAETIDYDEETDDNGG